MGYDCVKNYMLTKEKISSTMRWNKIRNLSALLTKDALINKLPDELIVQILELSGHIMSHGKKSLSYKIFF